MKTVIQREETIQRKIHGVNGLLQQESLVLFIYTDDGEFQDAVCGRLKRFIDEESVEFRDDVAFGCERRRSHGDDVRADWMLNERLMVYVVDTIDELRTAFLSVVL